MSKSQPRIHQPKFPQTSRSGTNVLLAMSWYYPEVHRGVAEFARDHNWHITCDFDDVVPKHWHGAGVITHLGARMDVWKTLKSLNVPIVDVTESRPGIHLPRVISDNAAVGQLAAEHFVDRGYQQYAFFHRWDLGVSRARLKGFRSALKSSGHRCVALCWQRHRGGRPDTRLERHAWLMESLVKLPKPIAIFANRDSEAVEVIEACISAGISIPDEVAVLGADNTELICDCLQVPLSSVDTNLERVGFEAASMLQRLINGEPPPEKPLGIAPLGVVLRQSTDALAVQDPRVMQALKFIHEHAASPISMMDVVKEVGISRSGLEKLFRQHFVRPPMAELRRVRIDLAKDLLIGTDEKITAIARRSGWETSHKLCRVFRQTVGISPLQFRRRNRQAG